MITIVPIQKVIIAMAVIYAIAMSIISLLFGVTGLASVSFMLKGALVLEIIILLFSRYWWRKLWARYPSLNKWLYPDLNGDWDVAIHWKWGGKTGIKNAKAHITQDLFRFNMDMVSDESESETLAVMPKKSAESCRAILYYLYRNDSKQGTPKPQPPHNGAAILKIDRRDINSLSGNYFTDRATNGHFELHRASKS